MIKLRPKPHIRENMLFILFLIFCWFSTPALVKFFIKFKKPSKKGDAPETPVVGIVLEENNGKFCLKIANYHDHHIPIKSTRELIELNQIDYLCLTARKIEGVPTLKKGDLVMWHSIAPFTSSLRGWPHSG